MDVKIKSVILNNRKKVFEVINVEDRMFEYPYSRLDIEINEHDPIVNLYIDKELASLGFTVQLKSGKEDSVLMDMILEYVKDPEYERKRLVYKLTLLAQKCLKESAVSKREIIRRMKTTPTQFYRLMDQKNANKSVDQMLKLLAALDYAVEFTFKKVA